MNCSCFGTNVFGWNNLQDGIEEYNRYIMNHFMKDNKIFLSRNIDIRVSKLKRKPNHTLHFLENEMNRRFFPEDISINHRIDDNYIESGTYPHIEGSMCYFVIQKEVDLRGNHLLLFEHYEVINEVSVKKNELLFVNGTLNGVFVKRTHTGLIYEIINMVDGCIHGLHYQMDKTDGKILKITGYLYGWYHDKDITYDHEDEIIAMIPKNVYEYE